MSRSPDAKPSGAIANVVLAVALVAATGLGTWFFRQFRRKRTALLVAKVVDEVRAAPPLVEVPQRVGGKSETVEVEPSHDAGDRSGAGEPLEADAFVELLGQADQTQKSALGGTNNDQPDPADKSGIFYGWFVVAAVFSILVVTSGMGFYNASVILAAATTELDASVGSVSGATGMFFAISGLTGFVFAKQLESVDIRWFFFAGGLVGAFALISLRWVTSVIQLYAFFALFGIGFGIAGLVPATTLVTRWFERRRAVAISVASTGLSVGGIVLTPVAAWLIDRRGLAGASPYMAAIWIAGIIPIALLVLRSHPSAKGVGPDGDPQVQRFSTDRKHPEIAGLDFAAARSSRFFVALCAAYALIFLGQVGAIAQLFNLVLERADNATAATALSTLALTSVVARLVGGALVLRLPTRGFTAMLAVLQACALALLATADTPITLILTSAFFGASVGNLLMLQPLLLAEAFGVANYGRIYSLNQLFGTLGVAGGPLLLGVIRDAYDYETAMLIAGAASFIGFGFIAAAGSVGAVQSLWQDTTRLAGRNN